MTTDIIQLIGIAIKNNKKNENIVNSNVCKLAQGHLENASRSEIAPEEDACAIKMKYRAPSKIPKIVAKAIIPRDTAVELISTTTGIPKGISSEDLETIKLGIPTGKARRKDSRLKLSEKPNQ